MSKAEKIAALPAGSVVVYDTKTEEGKVAFLRGVVYSGDDPLTAEETLIWVAPNMLTFDDEAFVGEDAPLDDLEILFEASPREVSA